MAFEIRDGSANMFENNKSKENQPDYKGNGRVGGVLVDVAAWKRKDKSGKTYFSLAIKPQGEYKKPEGTPPIIGPDGAPLPF